MHINEIPRDTRRGRFTVPTADLSAFGGYSAILIKKLMSIIRYICNKCDNCDKG